MSESGVSSVGHRRSPAALRNEQSGLTDSPVAVVQAKGLTKTFRAGDGQVKAVDAVNLTVMQQEMVVLLGPSGCGKTTLLRMIAGLEVPDEGSIEIGGKSVYSSGSRIFVPPERRQLGMMFQSYALWPHMTLFKNVAYPLTGNRNKASRKEIDARVREVLALVGLAGLADRYPSEISGGQQQRVALARALVSRPSVALFDEPLSNVDAKVRRRLRTELRGIKEQTGFAAIYVTHDQEEAMELADTLVVMSEGAIQQVGSARKVYTDPTSLAVAEFVGELNCLAGVISNRDRENVTVTTRVGQLLLPIARVSSRSQGRIGDKGVIGIRPEDLQASPIGALRMLQEGHERFMFEADILKSTFLGSRAELQVKVDSGAESFTTVIWIPNDHAIDTQPGARVRIGADSRKLLWFPD
jgi:iron(III) transport system ATP-binding protein